MSTSVVALALLSNGPVIIPLGTLRRIVCFDPLDGPSTCIVRTLDLKIADTVVNIVRLPMHGADLPLTHNSFRSAASKYTAVPSTPVICAKFDIAVTLCVQTSRQTGRSFPSNGGKTDTKYPCKIIKIPAVGPCDNRYILVVFS